MSDLDFGDVFFYLAGAVFGLLLLWYFLTLLHEIFCGICKQPSQRDQAIAVRNGAYVISIEEWREAIGRNNQRNIPFGHDVAFSTNQDFVPADLPPKYEDISNTDTNQNSVIPPPPAYSDAVSQNGRY